VFRILLPRSLNQIHLTAARCHGAGVELALAHDAIHEALWADSTGQRYPTLVVAFLSSHLAANS